MKRRWYMAVVAASLCNFARSIVAAAAANSTTAHHLAPPGAWALLTVVTAITALWVWLWNGRLSLVVMFATCEVLFVGRAIDFTIAHQSSAAGLNLVGASFVLALWVVTLRQVRDRVEHIL